MSANLSAAMSDGSFTFCPRSPCAATTSGVCVHSNLKAHMIRDVQLRSSDSVDGPVLCPFDQKGDGSLSYSHVSDKYTDARAYKTVAI